MDRDKALAAFQSYVAAYDATNPRIALKTEHTLCVTSLCDRIARGLGLPARDVDLAWIAGLLHDIGRFEQVRRYDTFNDAQSVSHAALGVEVLFGGDTQADEPLTGKADSVRVSGRPIGEHLEGQASVNQVGDVSSNMSPDGKTPDSRRGDEPANEPLIRQFVEDPSDAEALRIAIATHSDYRLPEDLDPRVHTLCTILRDADKIDILRVNCECPIEDIYGVSEATMRASEVSDECVRIFYQHRCLPRGVRRHTADIMLGHICFAWELVHPQSIEIVREQGHLVRMLTRTWDLPATQQAFDAMAAHMRAELGI